MSVQRLRRSQPGCARGGARSRARDHALLFLALSALALSVVGCGGSGSSSGDSGAGSTGEGSKSGLRANAYLQRAQSDLSYLQATVSGSDLDQICTEFVELQRRYDDAQHQADLAQKLQGSGTDSVIGKVQDVADQGGSYISEARNQCSDAGY